MARMKTRLGIAAQCVLALSLGACAGMKESMDQLVPKGPGMVAQLRSSATAATGVVHVYSYRDGISLQLAIDNLLPGPYRIAFHENANCRSPNLFSAGKPWAPPSFTKPAIDLLPGFTANAEGNENGYTVYVPGVYIDKEPSIAKRSIVVHWGNIPSEAIPGQPNNRVACGVFVPGDALFDKD